MLILEVDIIMIGDDFEHLFLLPVPLLLRSKTSNYQIINTTTKKNYFPSLFVCHRINHCTMHHNKTTFHSSSYVQEINFYNPVERNILPKRSLRAVII